MPGGTVAGELDAVPRSPITGSLPAYSGGTVWDSHPLPLTSSKRRKEESLPRRPAGSGAEAIVWRPPEVPEQTDASS